MHGKQKFLYCEHCGNLVGFIQNKGVPLMCCGTKMMEIAPNTKEAAIEKHLPAVTKDAGTITVQVGSTEHPMTEEHLITFVYVETTNGGQRKSFSSGEKPIAKFNFSDDTPIAIYAYCNLHGMWKVEL